jgi:hypothetical protein
VIWWDAANRAEETDGSPAMCVADGATSFAPACEKLPQVATFALYVMRSIHNCQSSQKSVGHAMNVIILQSEGITVECCGISERKIQRNFGAHNECRSADYMCKAHIAKGNISGQPVYMASRPSSNIGVGLIGLSANFT